MQINIKKCVAWSGNLTTATDWQQWAKKELIYQASAQLPLLTQIPAMQRRRLSSFAKITLHCILEALTEHEHNIPCVFSSRHGDLHKTAKLIEDVAAKEDLSPTHFGLSVHNAVAGLYSIFADNKQAMTAISAGEDSFLMALVDAYAKLTSQNLDKILVVYSDELVPEKYQAYVAETEQTLAVALLLEKKPSNDALTLTFNQQKQEIINSENQALAFLEFLHQVTTRQIEINSTRYQWQLSRAE